ncbi:hypothetical protein ABZ922_44745 [Streptomyces shenzhenensis]|uniref:hypothetical protein n=1 Tax=Streptomyces shenzhenensis TaxID=943815 RepID=UPI0033D76A32
MTHPTSPEVAGRIEDLYGAPLTDLTARARDQPPGMLSALLGMHDDLADAERSIAVHRARLAQLIHPERQIDGHEASHVLDCARRLAEAVAVRDVQARAVSAVLRSLGRVPAPQKPPDRTPDAPAVPVVSTVPARSVPGLSAARSR